MDAMSEPAPGERAAESPPAETSRPRDAMRWLSGLAALVGAWIVISPAVFEATEMGLWNNVIVGAAIFLIAGFNYYRLTTHQPSVFGAMILVVILGAWALIGPFLFEIGSDELLWSTAVAGLIALLSAGYVASADRRLRTGVPEAQN